MLWNKQLTKCPVGYCCKAMTGLEVWDCPNLETCLSLEPYHPSEFFCYSTPGQLPPASASLSLESSKNAIASVQGEGNHV